MYNPVPQVKQRRLQPSLLPQVRELMAVLMLSSLVGQQVASGQQGALPSGGTFVAGAGAISSSGNAIRINQTSTRGIIDWKTFSIGTGGSVLFNNGSGATLNRVTGGGMSSIFGSLVSTGTVYLINPEGVLIGPSGQIRTGGYFVASTLNLSNDVFLKGGSLLFSGPSTTLVKNLGVVSSSGGSVFLIAHNVDNGGKLNAPNGTVGLAAGQEVLLKDANNDERVFVHAGTGSVTNSGMIQSAEAELKAADGNIYALAGNNGGQIRATGTATRDGHVWLVSNGGTTSVAGSISAQSADGRGGSIETSGHNLSLDNSTVTTGKGGSWLIDPVDLTIDSSAASIIQSSLNGGTDVTLTTSATSASGPGTQMAGLGDINVASSIGWSTGSALTLSAYHDVNVQNGATISNTGAGSLTLRADNAAAGSGTVNFTGSGNVNFSGSSGNVSLFYHPSSYPIATNFSSKVTMGSGALTPYMTVDSMADLQNVNNNLAGTYALNKDLDASSVANFSPLAGGVTWTTSTDGFSGLFDGQQHTIDHLTITDTSGRDLNSVGLFAQISASGMVKNLGLTNVQVSSTSRYPQVGGLAGENWGHISNSYTTGTVAASNSNPYVGGLAGSNDGSISASYSSAQVSATATDPVIGGLVGYHSPNANGATITDSYSTGSVSAPSATTGPASVGSFVGFSNSGVITSSYSTGAVTASPYTDGGFVEYGSNGATVTNSYWDSQKTNQATSAGGGTALTTAQLQGSLPSGFSPSVWKTSPGQYPLLSWQPTSALVLSGTVFNGASPLASTAVAALVNGASAGTATTNASGFYSLSIPAGTSAVLAYLTGGAYKGNTFSDGGGTGSFTNVNIFTNTLQLIDKTHTAYSGMVNALGTTLGGNSGPDYLFGVSGGTLSLSSGTNLAIASTAPSLTIDSAINGAGTTLIQATGNLTLGGSGTISAAGTGNALTLSTGGTFTNNAGSLALNVSGGGRWLVYSQNPANDNRGGLAYDFKQYAATYGATTVAQSTGNGFLYTPAPTLTAGLTGNTSKTYDGTTSATLSAANYTLSGAVDNDVPTLTIATSGTYANKNAGTGKQVSVSGLSLASASNGGANVYGYQLSSSTASANIGIINPATLTYTANTATRTYGGSNPVLTGTVSGFVGSDTLASATTGTAAFTSSATPSSNVGSYAINGSGLTANNSNYTLQQASGNATALTINPANLTYTANSANRLYGASNPALTGAVTGFVNSDTLASATTGTAVFTSPATSSSNVGSYAVNGSGLAANNYTFTQAAGNAAALTINPATLTYTADAASRAYGANNPGFTGIVTGFVNGGTLASATSGTLAFTSPATAGNNVGTYAINGSGLTANNGNYTFAQAPGNAGALTINPATLLYTADPAARTYGSNNPTFTGSVTGLVNGDTLASATAGTLAFTSSSTASSNVGSYSVNGSGLTANSGNYVFGQASGNAAALTIDPATLTYTASASSRLYGAANPAFTGTITGFVNGDTLASATTGALAFSSPATAATNVGSYAINGSGLTAGNYAFAQASGNATALTINPATLTYAADAASRTYGATNLTFTGTVTGFVNSDTLASATTGNATFTSAATATSNIGTYGVNGSGLTANNGNYTFVQAPGNIGALTIDPATLTYTANPVSRIYGSNNPALTGAITGFVNGETLASATTGSATFISSATPSSNVGTYAVSGSGLTANYGNYNFAQAPGNAAALTVDPATLTYTANAATRTYGAVNPNLTGAVTGFVNGDTPASAITGTVSFSSIASTASNVGNYAINGSGLAANNGNYTFAQAPGNASALTIDPAALTYTASAASRTYGAGNPTLTGTVTGFVNGDTLSSATTGNASFTTTATQADNVGTHAITGSGLTANHGDYTFVQDPGNASALRIDPATLTYTADAVNRISGTPNPAFTGTVTGFVHGETLASATTGTAIFTSPATAASGVGTYGISGSGLTANHGNYLFLQAPGNATALRITAAEVTPPPPAPPVNPQPTQPVQPTQPTQPFNPPVGNAPAEPPSSGTVPTAPVTINLAVNNATRLANQPNPSFSTTYTGPALPGVDVAALIRQLTFQTSATTTSNAGSYQITLAGQIPGYVFNVQPGVLTVVDDSPKTIPTQITAQPYAASTNLAASTVAPRAAATSQLNIATPTAGGAAVLPNTLGNFDVNYSQDWSKALANGLKQSLAASSFVTAGENTSTTTSTKGWQK